MSQLIQMQRRIRAIETTKKITQAMRLISISMHTRLKKLEESFKIYESKIDELSSIGFFSDYISDTSNKNLFIVIGSNKGLCGTFNSQTAQYFSSLKISTKDEVITVGKQIFPLIKGKMIKEINSASSTHPEKTTNNIIETVRQNGPYKSINLVYSFSKSFFYQKPILVTITPKIHNSDIWWWPESKESIIKKSSELFIKSKITAAIIYSLVAEQASRFRSMDNATTNAKNLLDEMKLKYNKARQAKITKEITELSSNFQLQN